MPCEKKITFLHTVVIKQTLESRQLNHHLVISLFNTSQEKPLESRGHKSKANCTLNHSVTKHLGTFSNVSAL